MSNKLKNWACLNRIIIIIFLEYLLCPGTCTQCLHGLFVVHNNPWNMFYHYEIIIYYPHFSNDKMRLRMVLDLVCHEARNHLLPIESDLTSIFSSLLLNKMCAGNVIYVFWKTKLAYENLCFERSRYRAASSNKILKWITVLYCQTKHLSKLKRRKKATSGQNRKLP